MTISPRITLRTLLLGTAIAGLSGCTDPLDWDLRRGNGMLNTAPAAQGITNTRPEPDARGVISYPTYQAAVAQRGDTVADLAVRVGMDPGEVANYNGLSPSTQLRGGEVLVLPGGTSPLGSAPTTGAAAGSIDITTLASGAIDRAEAERPSGQLAPSAGTPDLSGGVEPARHRVERGETAYSIARSYNVSPRALAQWNGLGPDLAVREGQMLMIPVTLGAAARTETTSGPGEGSPTPLPPSASRPLPAQTPVAASRPAPATPASPNLAKTRTQQSKLAMPVSGAIIRAYSKGKNDGIDIGASAGTKVQAAEDGTVAAITKDTDQVTILVLRHKDNLLTVYANIDTLTVAKGASVKRGQTVGSVRAGSPSFLHFEVRRGFESIDPMPYLK